MVSSLSNKPYDKRLAARNMLSLGNRRLRGKLIECFKILNGFRNIEKSTLFEIDDKMRTRDNDIKFV